MFLSWTAATSPRCSSARAISEHQKIESSTSPAARPEIRKKWFQEIVAEVRPNCVPENGPSAFAFTPKRRQRQRVFKNRTRGTCRFDTPYQGLPDIDYLSTTEPSWSRIVAASVWVGKRSISVPSSPIKPMGIKEVDGIWLEIYLGTAT